MFSYMPNLPNLDYTTQEGRAFNLYIFTILCTGRNQNIFKMPDITKKKPIFFIFPVLSFKTCPHILAFLPLKYEA